MQCRLGGMLLAVGVPAGLVERVGDGVDVEGVGGEGEDAHVGVAEDAELRDGVDAIDQGARSCP